MDIRFLLGLGVALSALFCLVAYSPIPVWLPSKHWKQIEVAAVTGLLVCLFWFLAALWLHDPSVRP